MEQGLIVGGATVPGGNIQIAIRAKGDSAPVMVELGLVPAEDDALSGQVRLVGVRLGDAELREIVRAVEVQPYAPWRVATHGPGVHHVELAIFLEFRMESHAQQTALVKFTVQPN